MNQKQVRLELIKQASINNHFKKHEHVSYTIVISVKRKISNDEKKKRIIVLKKKRCHNDNSPLQRPNNGGRKAQKQYDVSTMRMSGKNQNEHHRISHSKQLLWGGLGGI